LGILSRCLTGAVGVAYTKGLDGLHIIDNCARFGLPVPDCGGTATEWKGGGPGWSIWRHGFADGVRSTRLGDAAFEGDDGFGDSIHANVADAFDPGDPGKRRGKYGSRKTPRPCLDETAGDFDNDDSGAGSDSSGFGNARSAGRGEAWTTVGHADGSEDRRKQDDASRVAASTGGHAPAAASEEVAGQVR